MIGISLENQAEEDRNLSTGENLIYTALYQDGESNGHSGFHGSKMPYNVAVIMLNSMKNLIISL
jgi:hypothetical protein